MSNRNRGLAALALALGALVPASALGSSARTVGPTPAQRAAILKAWAAGTAPPRADAACLVVRLAASNHRYGTVRFRRTQTCEQHWAFNGVNVEKRARHGHWRVVFEGSAYQCPLARIPSQVQRDLKICY